MTEIRFTPSQLAHNRDQLARHTAHISEAEKDRAGRLLVMALNDLDALEQWQGFASVAADHILMAMDVLNMKAEVPDDA